MRRVLALIAAVVLVGSLAGSSLATGTPPSSSFVGNFDLLTEDGTLLGHSIAQLFEPTNRRLVPGSHDFRGAPSNAIRESHAVIGGAHFWFDTKHLPAGAKIPGGYVARGDGVECVYYAPNVADCYKWWVQFVDNVDPSVRNEVMFGWENADNSWGETTQFVGKGYFVLRCIGSSCPTDP